MLGELGWGSLEERCTDSKLCLFYKIVHGLAAVPLPPYVMHAHVLTRHSTSHSLAFRQIHTVADFYKLSPSIALLLDIDTFRLAVSSLICSKP